jgi:PAS domain S-box-containing protein
MNTENIKHYKVSAEQLEEALNYSESIISTIREPLVVLDSNLRIISVNRSFYREFSATPEETEGKLIYEVADGQWNIPELRELLENILPKNTSFENYEVDHEFPHLGRRIMMLNARRIYDGGKTDKILLAIEDITKRKLLEKEMTTSELRYRRLFESAQDGILILDAQTGEITDVNPFLQKMLGYSKQELEGKRIWEIGFFKDAEASRQAFQVLQDKGYIRYEDLPLESRDRKPMQVEFVSNLYAINGDSVIQCNIRDITDRKRAEEESKRYASELEAVNKELESFSYSVSHDLRAPLRALDGFSEMVIQDYGDKLDETGKDYLNRIRKASQTMSRLIDDLLKLSRIARIEMHEDKVNLSEIALTIVEELKANQPERQSQTFIAPEIWAKGDKELLRICLNNILQNAWNFTVRCPVASIELNLTEKNGECVYYVKDNGVGFDMQYADKLFQPFQRLHSEREFQGTGIGLTIAQRVINRHGGRIWAEAEIGKGATFYFTLKEGNGAAYS